MKKKSQRSHTGLQVISDKLQSVQVASYDACNAKTVNGINLWMANDLAQIIFNFSIKPPNCYGDSFSLYCTMGDICN